VILSACTLPAVGSRGQRAGPGSSPQTTFACPVTLPNGKQLVSYNEPLANHGNDAGTLFTSLWPDGRVVFRPGGPGQILHDGSLEMKGVGLDAVDGNKRRVGDRWARAGRARPPAPS
jgi:hypothetical protein